MGIESAFGGGSQSLGGLGFPVAGFGGWGAGAGQVGYAEARHQRRLAEAYTQQHERGIQRGRFEAQQAAVQAMGHPAYATAYRRHMLTARDDHYGDIAYETDDYGHIERYYQDLLSGAEGGVQTQNYVNRMRQAQAARGMYFGPTSAKQEAQQAYQHSEALRQQGAAQYTNLLALRAQTRTAGRAQQLAATQALHQYPTYQQDLQQRYFPQMAESYVREYTGGVMGWQGGHPNPTPMLQWTGASAAGAAGAQVDAASISAVGDLLGGIGGMQGAGAAGGGGGGGNQYGPRSVQGSSSGASSGAISIPSLSGSGGKTGGAAAPTTQYPVKDIGQQTSSYYGGYSPYGYGEQQAYNPYGVYGQRGYSPYGGGFQSTNPYQSYYYG